MKQRLMRTWYKTDAILDDSGEPEGVLTMGAFTEPFRPEGDGRRIVAVDWSTPGEVEVTWLIPWDL